MPKACFKTWAFRCKSNGRWAAPFPPASPCTPLSFAQLGARKTAHKIRATKGAPQRLMPCAWWRQAEADRMLRLGTASGVKYSGCPLFPLPLLVPCRGAPQLSSLVANLVAKGAERTRNNTQNEALPPRDEPAPRVKRATRVAVRLHMSLGAVRLPDTHHHQTSRTSDGDGSSPDVHRCLAAMAARR